MQSSTSINQARHIHFRQIKAAPGTLANHSQLVAHRDIMLSKVVPLFLVIGTALAMMPVKPQVSADRSLVDFMLQNNARGVGIGDPALKQYCFNRYLPILKDVTDQYEADYNKCVSTYQAECAGIDAKYLEPRENSARIAKETCDALLKCDSNENYVDAFDCYASTVSSLRAQLAI